MGRSRCFSCSLFPSISLCVSMSLYLYIALAVSRSTRHQHTQRGCSEPSQHGTAHLHPSVGFGRGGGA